ncbi:hypothetical protein MSG28_006817 [Choristoneura fumiferana]|uniref:Uncharacterized protein n=3 Tax=Choristoneura fumiferana TaxID=7141 RepID=A0ACC0JLA7_CHOFU|nr:hypothetical protein MSG28_006805 [Choristoneura fumiferana]KAI8424890.1 hypothetical protein MSG28_006810 [Choristoneura fumiferana]KAI8424897.1 hypothetical protein MSG28_006817 [Choristoneura fumiferana]
MAATDGGYIDSLSSLLQQDYRGVNIAVYALATAGLAVSIHKIRPVSKFSKASQVPEHFIRRHEPLRGQFAGVQHSPVRVLVQHRAPLYLPLWHSSKPPLPVKLWGVDIVSGNAVNWLECVARGQQVTLKPIARDKDSLVSTVLLHLPQEKTKKVETLDIGQKLVELGFAKASVPLKIQKNTIESKLAPVLLSAEQHAKNYRNGIWSDSLPPLPVYVVYWRKGSQLLAGLVLLTVSKLVDLVKLASRSAFVGVKYLALRPLRSRKPVQAS